MVVPEKEILSFEETQMKSLKNLEVFKQLKHTGELPELEFI